MCMRYCVLFSDESLLFSKDVLNCTRGIYSVLTQLNITCIQYALTQSLVFR